MRSRDKSGVYKSYLGLLTYLSDRVATDDQAAPCNDLIQAGQGDTDPQGYQSALDPKTRAYVNVIVDETIRVHREPT